MWEKSENNYRAEQILLLILLRKIVHLMSIGTNLTLCLFLFL